MQRIDAGQDPLTTPKPTDSPNYYTRKTFDMDVNALKRKKAEALKAAEALHEKLDGDGLTADQRKEAELQADSYVALAKSLNDQLEGKLSAENIAMGKPAGERHPDGQRRAQPDKPGAPIPSGFGGRSASVINSAMRVAEFKSMDPGQLDTGDFNSLADFAQSVFRQRNGFGADQRLVNYSASQSGSDGPSGGFIVPTRFSQEILRSDDASEPWLEMVDRTMLPPGFGKVSLPAVADRDRSGKTVGGLKLTRRSESSTVTESTVTLTRDELELDSAGTIVKVSQELLEDSMPGSVDEMLRGVFGSALTQTLSEDVVGTTTSGVPRGIIQSDATFVVPKEGAQSADTIVGENILRMRERMKPSSLGRAVWLVAPEVYRQLVNAHTTMTNDDFPLFVHGNGRDVPDTLLGRPIYATEACSTLGDKGDIVFADLSKYRHIMRGPIIDSSPHIGFETNEVFYKFLIRDFGAPKFNGTYKTMQGFEVAEFVTLAERA